MKNLLPIFLISAVFIFFIYQINYHTTYNITSLNDLNTYFPTYDDYLKDELKYHDYTVINYNTIKEMYYSITNNNEINHIHIKKIINDSSVIIINIGYQELIYKESYMSNKLFNEIIIDYTKLISEILKLNNNIILINLNNPKNDKYIMLFNDYIAGLSKKNNLNLIDISKIKSNNTNQYIYQEIIRIK